MKTIHKLFSIGLLSAAVGVAHAAPILNISDEGQTAADAAEATFLSSLDSSATEDFESYPAASDSSGQSLLFSSTTAGDFSVEPGDVGTGGACNTNGFECDAGLAVLNSSTTPFGGRFATSPDNWLDSMDAQVMTFSPNAGNNALGFFMTDPNDAGGRFSINGEDFSFEDIFGSSLGNGKVFYLSLFDSNGLNDVSIHSNNGNDGYGIDDVTIGHKVPEPGTLALLGLGLAGLGISYRRRA